MESRWKAIAGLPVARATLGLTAQLVLALAFARTGKAEAWRQSAAWWVAWLVPVNLLTVGLVVRRERREGRRFADLFARSAEPPRKDLPWYLLALIVSVPLGVLPNLLLGRLLWDSPFAGAGPAFGAMPRELVWALLLLVPVTQALAEPPLYLGYVLPHLLSDAPNPRRAIVGAAALMAGQNAFFPLLFDARFIVWRALMFLPLCLWLAWLVARRPTVLPYLAVAHGLMNVSLVLLVLRVSLPVG